MKISIRGVRGSIPVSGSDYEQYGGNTTCVVVTESDWMLILDGGSGLQQFNLLENTTIKRVDILLTHLHLDHIQGLGFFNPFLTRIWKFIFGGLRAIREHCNHDLAGTSRHHYFLLVFEIYSVN